jgi:hypothetical protein
MNELIILLAGVFIGIFVNMLSTVSDEPEKKKEAETYVRYHTKARLIVKTIWERTNFFKRYGSELKTESLRAERFKQNYVKMYWEVCKLMDIDGDQKANMLQYRKSVSWRTKQRVNHMLEALGIFHIQPSDGKEEM